MALGLLGVLAGRYQPLAHRGAGGGLALALSPATGLRLVNTFGGAAGELYVPPQRGTCAVRAGIRNSGREAVTIEAVTMLDPADPIPRLSGTG